MIYKKPTEVLEEEHHFIKKVVGAMAILAEELEEGKQVETKTLESIADFMRTFGDKCHHGKEEAHLFPALERKGVPMRGCPLGALVAEHQKGRNLVKELSQATTDYATSGASAKDSLLKSLHGLIDLYPNHIWKEDYLAFPMANKILSDDEQRELSAKFEMVEDEIGRDVHHRFEQLAKELEERVGKR
ncbi:MAG TPA: hemerythrin domain-containing protein [Methylomirabilota bacterium]|jgi:hemerythrin-like domain-containing protein|nr:hemerythrin domain-containing protein [Methylomirabilota bacterium]